MKIASRLLPFLLALGGVASALAPQDGADEPRYVRVAGRNATLRNLPDVNGIEIGQVESGTLLAVYGEQAGWLEVETPEGFVVWVYGRYLRATDAPHVFEVTRNAVNVRPKPKSDVTNFPLPQRLHAGDRVQVIDQLEPEKPLEESWVRIWSPPGVHAFLRGDQVQALEPGQDGGALWAATERPRSRPTRRVGESVDPPIGAAAASAKAAEENFRSSLGELSQALDAEAEKESPNFVGLRGSFELAVASAPTGALAAEARRELDRLSALVEVRMVQTELERERERRVAEASAQREAVLASSRSKDPLGDVFRVRGVLVRDLPIDGAPRYRMRFGGKDVCEILCTSARYDLDLFTGYEVGVFGQDLPGTAAGQGLGMVIDIGRLEVLARR